ncbi:MAG: DUF3137 domain-containing protein [Pseudomonadota bacterium]
MHQFEESHPRLAGFSQVYAGEVRATLLADEGERRKMARAGLFMLLACGSGAFIVGLCVFLLFGSFTGLLFIWMAGGLLGLLFYASATHRVRHRTKATLTQSVFAHIGWTFTQAVSDFDYKPFLEVGLLDSRITGGRFEDAVSGEVRGAAFTAVEATLHRPNKNSRNKGAIQQEFHGQLIVMDFPTRTFGRTVVYPDKGVMNWKRRDGLKRVGLVDPTFERMYEAYGTDQVEARVILNPTFMQQMTNLKTALLGRDATFAFDTNRLFIAIKTRNRFEAGSMRRSLDDPERAQRLLTEASAILHLIEGVAG